MAALEFIKYYRGAKIYELERPGEIRLLLWIAEHCTYEGVVITRYLTMAKQLKINRRYAITCVKRLEDDGWIETRPEVGKHVAIWIKRGFGFGSATEPPQPPQHWDLHNYKQDELDLK